MPKINYVYVDSCVFLAYFNAEPSRITLLDRLFEQIQKADERKIITSVLSITEVAHLANEKSRRQMTSDIEERFDSFWGDTSLVEFIDVHEAIARNARQLMREAIPHGYALKPADSIHLASANIMGVAEFFTYDNLSKFEVLVNFEIREPYVTTKPKLI
jgi:predicted nucleic acid-binding protein